MFYKAFAEQVIRNGLLIYGSALRGESPNEISKFKFSHNYNTTRKKRAATSSFKENCSERET